MEYIDSLPWTGKLFHPFTQEVLIENGQVHAERTAAYWKLREGCKNDHLNPVAVNHHLLQQYWARILKNYPNIKKDDLIEIIYEINTCSLGWWDNFVCITVLQKDPEIEHIIICTNYPEIYRTDELLPEEVEINIYRPILENRLQTLKNIIAIEKSLSTP